LPATFHFFQTCGDPRLALLMMLAQKEKDHQFLVGEELLALTKREDAVLQNRLFAGERAALDAAGSHVIGKIGLGKVERPGRSPGGGGASGSLVLGRAGAGRCRFGLLLAGPARRRPLFQVLFQEQLQRDQADDGRRAAGRALAGRTWYP